MFCRLRRLFVFGAALCSGGCTGEPADLVACVKLALGGIRLVAEERTERFEGKVREETARCRGGERAVAMRNSPWTDWQNYWAAGDALSRGQDASWRVGELNPNRRGIEGALLDLEYQRIELLKFNLFDNSGTYPNYAQRPDGALLRVWSEMRLPLGHPQYRAVGAADTQLCWNELIRFRSITGICNDIENPLMGSSGQPFARNVEFEATFPDLGKNEPARNRHRDRLGLLRPDPQLISRRLFTRAQSGDDRCRQGRGLPGHSPEAECDYKKAPLFNVLAAFWIQFMTHDWFSHLSEGHNSPAMTAMGCATQMVDGEQRPLTKQEIARLGCRADDRVDRALTADDRDPSTFIRRDTKTGAEEEALARAYKTTSNTVTAWWDASQIYGYDERSVRRVKRDPKDPAKLLLVPARAGEEFGYLPVFDSADPISPQWAGQETAAFPDNWSIGLSFFHNVFAREHNAFVDEFRKQAQEEDSGLRDPARPDRVIRYQDVTAGELFDIARLVVAAEIAKIHTLEWTTQLLYDDPLFRGMNANWNGLLAEDKFARRVADGLAEAVKKSKDPNAAVWYSILASSRGIVGTGNDACAGRNIFAAGERGRPDPVCVNGGTRHFGSPFNFPEEFVTVYRLHPMVPDLIEYREWNGDPNVVRSKIPLVETFRGGATNAMRERGLANWALSMGRQRLGKLALQNHPQFLQNLDLPRLRSTTGKIDVAALDILRDRERGVPRYNEFRRQYGLRQLTGFDDFVDPRLPAGSSERAEQERLAAILREVYGQHRCDASKIITNAQLNKDQKTNDCLDHKDGSMVDNIEDLDTVVGWLAESARPHGFAISETQFQVFILNASRRLLSDRFFTSSFRREFYTQFGIDWVNRNGPTPAGESRPVNGHRVEVSPLKRVLLRTIPELKPELEHVVNVFDPWARARGEYYSLEWRPRADAESDPAFAEVLSRSAQAGRR